MPRTTATNRLVIRNYDFAIENKSTNYVSGTSATFTPPFSLIIKVKTKNLNQNAALFSLRGISNNLFWGFNFASGDRKQFLYLGAGGGHGVASSLVVDDNFHSLCITLSGTNINLYADGAQDGAANQPISMSAQTFTWRLFQEPSGSNSLIGTIQDFQVYNKVLSLSEIQQEHFNNIIPTGLTDRFLFTAGAGTLLTNIAGGTLSASLSNSAMWTTDTWMKQRAVASGRVASSGRVLI